MIEVVLVQRKFFLGERKNIYLIDEIFIALHLRKMTTVSYIKWIKFTLPSAKAVLLRDFFICIDCSSDSDYVQH